MRRGARLSQFNLLFSERDGVRSSGRMMGAVLAAQHGVPTLRTSHPDATDSQSQIYSPPSTPQTSLRDANQPVRVLASASPSIHLRQAFISRLFLSTLHPPHRSSRFSAAATLSSLSFQSIRRTPPPAGQRVFCSHALIQNSHFSRTMRGVCRFLALLRAYKLAVPTFRHCCC